MIHTNIPNVFCRDRDIPAGTVLTAEYGTVDRSDMAREEVLDTFDAKQFGTVNLIARHAGWSIAGSCLRWDNGAYGAIWESNGTRGGRWYRSLDEAADHFGRIRERAAAA